MKEASVWMMYFLSLMVSVSTNAYLAINGDVGWISSSVRRKSEMLRYWNRLIHMDSERLTKTFFIGILIEDEHLGIGIVIFTKCFPLLIS